MAGKRNWVDEAAQQILALGKHTTASAQRAAANAPSLRDVLTTVQQNEMLNAQVQREAGRQMFGDPIHPTSRNPFEISREVQVDPRFKGVSATIGHNDMIDALRHAEASRRVSSAIGTPAATVLGLGVEALGLLRREPFPETMMDLHNNREGRRAFVERRAVDPRNLQAQPRFMTPSGRYSPK